MTHIISRDIVLLNDGYVGEINQLTDDNQTWFDGYVYVPIQFQQILDLRNYEKISRLLRSPINLAYGTRSCIGFNTKNQNHMNVMNHLKHLQNSLHKYYQKYIPCDGSEEF